MSDSKKTVKEAMVAVALEEIDELTDKLEAVSKSVNHALEAMPSYLEEASNQTIDNIRHGVLVNIEIAQNALTQAQEKLNSSIEIQRRLNSQLKSLTESIDVGNNQFTQILIPAVGAFCGALVAVLLGFLF